MVADTVQDEPSYFSVKLLLPLGPYPAIPKAAVCVPAPAKALLPAFKFPPDVQDEPSYS